MKIKKNLQKSAFNKAQVSVRYNFPSGTKEKKVYLQKVSVGEAECKTLYFSNHKIRQLIKI